MPKWTALYYPTVEPPPEWLRSAALFFDEITSFVPAESEDTLSDELQEFAEATRAWTPYRPTESTALLVDVRVDALDKAFDLIAKERTGTPGHFEVLIEGTQVRVQDHVFMHGSKLSPRVRERLFAHGLMLPEGFAEPFMKGDWWVVNQRASDVVLSQIADSLAARRGWTSITDNEGCYVFNALDWTEAPTGPKEAEDQLARMLVTELVPDEISALPIEKYVELRHRYASIRECLAGFIDQVIIENRLGRIGDPVELRKEIHNYVQGLSTEIQKFRESAFGRTFRKWGPFSLGGFVTIAATLSGQVWALPLAGASVLFGAADKAGVCARKASKRDEMVRLVAAARKDVVSSVRRL